MLPPLCILAPGHGDKGDHVDPGAEWLDKTEAEEVRHVARAGAEVLHRFGWSVCIVDRGPYPYRWGKIAERIARNDWSICVAVHVHENSAAPPGNYGSGLYIRGHDAGEILAESLAHAVLEHAPEVARARAIATWDDRKEPEPWRYRGWSLNGKLWKAIDEQLPGRADEVAIAVYEPIFLNQRAHAALTTPDGRRRLGEALAVGVDAWGVAEYRRRRKVA